MDKAAERVSSPGGVWAALLLLFAGAFVRCPPILLHGRVWAEESSIFLTGAWQRSFGAELVAPEFGYYSVWDNFFAAVSAHVVPLPWAAMLYTWSAMVLLLVTGWFVYEAEFLPGRAAKTVAVLTLLLTAPSVETWLNLINSEFFFGIAGAVILFSDAARHRVGRGAMLLVAVLSGPLLTLLAPMYFLRAVLRRRQAEWVQAGVVCGGALAQVGIHLLTHTDNRTVHPQVLTLGPVLLNKQFVLLFFDRLAAKGTYLLLRDRMHFSMGTLVVCGVLLLLLAGSVLQVLRGARVATLLYGTALYLAVLEAALALNGGLAHVGPGGGERYAFTPNVLMEIALAAAAFGAVRSWRRTAARVLLGLALVSGGLDYTLLLGRDRGVWEGEPWREQARRWERDPATVLRGSPESWQGFRLPPH